MLDRGSIATKGVTALCTSSNAPGVALSRGFPVPWAAADWRDGQAVDSRACQFEYHLPRKGSRTVVALEATARARLDVYHLQPIPQRRDGPRSDRPESFDAGPVQKSVQRRAIDGVHLHLPVASNRGDEHLEVVVLEGGEGGSGV